MQDRYTGDVGDFVKYGLLRAIREGRQLGIAWYLHPNVGPSGDGSHTHYLSRPEEFRNFDSELFDHLKSLRSSGIPSVDLVEKSGILGNAVFAREPLDITGIRVRDRNHWRNQWFEQVRGLLTDCDLVFADPDNGLYPDEKFKPTQKVSAKRISLAEAIALAEGRTAIFYHHNTRTPGGHYKEIRHWMSQLPGCSYAYYWRRWSNRTFFIVNPDRKIEHLLRNFAERWNGGGELIAAP